MNEYLKVFSEQKLRKDRLFLDTSNYRNDLVHKYAWAVPTPEAISLIAKHCISPVIVEIGAGSGYWAKLIADAGKRIIAYDAQNGDYQFTKSWFPVMKRDHTVVEQFNNLNAGYFDLFMCWPPMDSWTAEVIDSFLGNTLVYVGEYQGGCNAVDKFFDVLDRKFTEIHHDVSIPRYWGIYDSIRIFKRSDA